MSESRTHINNEVTKLVEELKPRLLQCFMETCSLQDFLDDGKTSEEYESHIENYAIFVAEPYSGHCEPLITRTVRDRCGRNVDVKYHAGCYEYEIQRLPESECTSELKPCPFCGFSEAAATLVGDYSEIHCPCGARGPALGSEKLAEEAWNSRARWPNG